eukprot:16043592-Heterocapsa_arctica.AAC.1
MAMSKNGKAICVNLRGEDGQVDRQAIESSRAASDAVAQADQQAADAPRGCNFSKICKSGLVDGEGDASRPRGAGGPAGRRIAGPTRRGP